jgi:murein L,D-transpeptidase YcbB/YkuD
VRLRLLVAGVVFGLSGAIAVAPAGATPVVATAPADIDPAVIATAIAGQARGRLKAFYAARDFQPLWVASGRIGPAADALRDLLASAADDGLKPDRSRLAALDRAIAAAGDGDPRAIARAELKLSSALARQVRAMRKPGESGMVWLDPSLKPRKLEDDAVLRAAALPPSLADYVTTLGWMSPHYVALRQAIGVAHAAGMPPEDLARIARNRDRARALPGPWVRHVVVDAGSGRLFWYEAGRQKGVMRVVVGKPQSPTPMLVGMLHYAILNPYWNVPVDLVQTSVAPKILAGQSLASLHFEALSDWSAAPERLDPARIDWTAVAVGRTELRLRQLPGAGNAMGRVKFLFPNDLGIYLHDTPDRALFRAADRHFSNGCIRLEDAPALGQWLLGKPLRMPKTPEQAVTLPVPVPVFLTYLTVEDRGDGSIGFRPDVYGRDQ